MAQQSRNIRLYSAAKCVQVSNSNNVLGLGINQLGQNPSNQLVKYFLSNCGSHAHFQHTRLLANVSGVMLLWKDLIPDHTKFIDVKQALRNVIL